MCTPRTGEAKGMQIFVRNLRNETIKIEVKGGDTLRSLKEKIQEKEGVLPDQQRLTFAGKQLEGKKYQTLTGCGITKECTLTMNGRLRGGMKCVEQQSADAVEEDTQSEDRYTEEEAVTKWIGMVSLGTDINGVRLRASRLIQIAIVLMKAEKHEDVGEAQK